MILLYLLLFLVSLVLYLWGGLHEFLALALMGTAVAALIYYAACWLIDGVKLSLFKRKNSCRWLGRFWHLNGLPLLPEQEVYLYLTDQEELNFESHGWAITRAVESLNRLHVFSLAHLKAEAEDAAVESFKIKGTPYERSFYLSLKRAREADYPRLLVVHTVLENEREEWMFLAFRHGKGKMQKLLNRVELKDKVQPIAKIGRFE